MIRFLDGCAGVVCSPVLRLHHFVQGHVTRWDRCKTCKWRWVAFR